MMTEKQRTIVEAKSSFHRRKEPHALGQEYGV
jgi:hypothetical protein